MKTHVMSLSPDSFEMIEVGIKTIEMRLYDEKRKKISRGDYIKFISTMNDNKQLDVKVIDIYRYNNFEELYKEFNKVKLGYREDEISHYTDMEQYYSKEDIAKYGVIGIEVEVIRRIYL